MRRRADFTCEEIAKKQKKKALNDYQKEKTPWQAHTQAAIWLASYYKSIMPLD